MNELNCHFVSRFLTKPWEFGQRQLWYYDFDRRKIEKQSSRTLFAKVGRNTAEIEKLLNELIETPISNAIRTLVPSGAIDNVEISEWRLFRALNLLLLLQCSRASEKESHRSKLGQALSWDETTLDQLVRACGQTHIIVGLRGHSGAPFCYPSHGFFAIPVRQRSGSFAAIYAIPLTEYFAVAKVRRDVNMDDTFQKITCCQKGYVSNSSVGTIASRVIIHPSVIEAHGSATAARMIENARKGVLEMFSLCGEINKLDREMYEIVFGKFGYEPLNQTLEPTV
ncbi:MAG: hypothetical protein HY575_05995 [candidate division NC10 bacterium]|nr:hypothetical protein [candidate division NC10 bacterium]